MELIPCDVEALHLGFADFDALLVAACVERTPTFRPVLLVVAPINSTTARRSVSGRLFLRDVAEQPVLDLVPLRCARRIVVDADHESALIGQLLQFDFPEAHTRTIR